MRVTAAVQMEMVGEGAANKHGPSRGQDGPKCLNRQKPGCGFTIPLKANSALAK
jgi:hypothetical protein